MSTYLGLFLLTLVFVVSEIEVSAVMDVGFVEIGNIPKATLKMNANLSYFHSFVGRLILVSFIFHIKKSLA